MTKPSQEMTPNYTLIEYKTEHGMISAIVKTGTPDTIVFGFTDHDSCISYLRRNRQRRYLQDGEVHDIPMLPGHTKYDRELETWYQDFLKEIYPYATTRTTTVLHTESRREIDHCIITDTTVLYCQKTDKNIVFKKSFYTTWGGSNTITTTEDSPKERLKVIELIRANKDAILKELALHYFCK